MRRRPTRALDGLRLDATGAGLLTVNVSVEETPPPGAGLLTLIVSMPAGREVCRPEAESSASCSETKVLVRAVPLTTIDAPVNEGRAGDGEGRRSGARGWRWWGLGC